MQVRIVQGAFDPHAELSDFVSGRHNVGALASFIGYCRAVSDGVSVQELYIDHYPGFTEGEIARLAGDVDRRCQCADILVIHRVGAIRPGEAIILVAAQAAHRSEAFRAVEILMDYLKTDAPLWKKEIGPDGEFWIEPRVEDHARRAKAEEKHR